MHVYVITNTVNDKRYIGQYSKENLKKRLKQHINAANNSTVRKTYLHSAIRKYGPDAFTIQSLVRPIDKQQMDELEKFFIRTFETRNPDIGYNLTDGGDGSLGCKHTEEWCRANSKKHCGKFLSEETRLKISKTSKGRPSPQKGIPRTEESRRLQSQAMMGKPAWNAGKTGVYSAESLAKMSQSRKSNKPARNKGIKTGKPARHAKLTTSLVLEIRALYVKGDVSQKLLGQRFGVSRSSVQAIVSARADGHKTHYAINAALMAYSMPKLEQQASI